MKRIICIYGGPGSGKSTTCAGLFYKLKLARFNCEMNREYVKDWVWEDRRIKLGDQPYIFAKSARKERIYMESDIDFIITDSPLLLTHFYGMKYDRLEQESNTSLIMLKHHHKICQEYGYKIDHYLLERVKPYQAKGRFQEAAEAATFDKEMEEMLTSLNIKFDKVPGDETAVDLILRKYIQIPFHTVNSG